MKSGFLGHLIPEMQSPTPLRSRQTKSAVRFTKFNPRRPLCGRRGFVQNEAYFIVRNPPPMPHAGFAGVGHRMGHMKACNFAFLCAGRYTGSGGIKSGLVCMFYAGFAGVEHRKRMALHWVRYWLVLAALHTLLCPTSAKPTLGIKGEKRPKRLKGG